MLTQSAEYALRAAVYIARNQDEGPTSARIVAKATKVPQRYMQKILRDLVLQGVFRSSRGLHGGFKLTRSADKVRLMQIVRPFVSALQRSSCPFGNRHCGDDDPCPVHERWSCIVRNMKAFLDQTTLADIVETIPE